MSNHLEEHTEITALSKTATLAEAITKINEIIDVINDLRWEVLGRESDNVLQYETDDAP